MPKSRPATPEGRLARAVSSTGHPALHRVLAHLDADSFDERFEHGLPASLSR
ncbi:hypothetical protein ACFQU9_18930 [Actinomadura namibiensis]|uniref:Uncharacterized protein n=1 Tax=Actinomadura namibiensis TaxID=182080 RepID=A0A7W3LXB2_ACTNM|nr:hypothetical protein [Actinomadura namibiensis]MBA8956041.1 hypothetical protein [Actinomadura namibiensis]